MIDKKILYYRYNQWWEDDYMLNGIIKRPKLIQKTLPKLESKAILLLTGLRRIGKTTLMRILIKYLINSKGINPKNIFYISVDNYCLKNMSLEEIISEYRKIHRIKSDEKVWLFLDEITVIDDFEIQLKNFYDSYNCKIIAASSSASLLKTKKDYITGRNSIIEVPPLDFSEYMLFKNIKVKYADRELLEEYFEDYLKTGGIPEYILNGDIDYLRELVDDIIRKDIAAVHGIKNIALLRDYFMLLMERAGKIVSVNKIARILEISVDTARRYLSFFEDTYLVYTVNRAGKPNEQLKSPKKIYAADLGIRVMITGFRDKGSLFENYIYHKIKSRNPQYLLENTIEIDFITEDKTLIEAKYYDKLRPKQQELFDKYDAKEKLVIASVYDLEIIEGESFHQLLQKRDDLFTNNDLVINSNMIMEDESEYIVEKKKCINLGRSKTGFIINKPE